MLADLFAHTPLTERQIKDLKQAVMEMGGNAIEWGHRKNADLVLRITYRIDPTAVTLIITDQGPGFNPRNLPHAASDDDPIGHLDIRNELGLREGGFGIMLARGPGRRVPLQQARQRGHAGQTLRRRAQIRGLSRTCARGVAGSGGRWRLPRLRPALNPRCGRLLGAVRRAGALFTRGLGLRRLAKGTTRASRSITSGCADATAGGPVFHARA